MSGTSDEVQKVQDQKLPIFESVRPKVIGDLTMRDGVICCVISTEALEIPNNDHIIFPPIKRSSTLSANQKNAKKAKKQHCKKSR
ncbi:hypothetical protein H5410_024683 [Solanum commersonii]|uniref:Uncharacterized protein n=1 Tax=Solanum commersonii TaxID=4109 RepID=A0A9J5ZMR2_SOLCO|nr:hypothetical protein H5410_024683 [Solanum commersonii]